MIRLLLSLTLLLGLMLASAPAAEPPALPSYAAVLTVKRMCCAKESVPAIKELSKIEGVKRVAVNYKTRSLMIEPTDVTPSAQAIWDAADRLQIGPVRLATTAGVYTARPQN